MHQPPPASAAESAAAASSWARGAALRCGVADKPDDTPHEAQAETRETRAWPASSKLGDPCPWDPEYELAGIQWFSDGRYTKLYKRPSPPERPTSPG